MHNKTRRRRRFVMDGPVACTLERLEGRVFLSLSAVGGELQVNGTTLNVQTNPAITVDGDGDFVVVWESSTGDGAGYGVFAQRYNASGGALGTEFRVNTHTTNTQKTPTVAADADGDFVVAWTSIGQEGTLVDGSGYGIYAQRYNSAGVAVGGEFHVNTTTAGGQDQPAIAMDAAGNFVVVWKSDFQDGGFSGIYAQRFNHAGIAQGTEFRVNTYTTNSQIFPAVAMDPNGNFAVAWNSDAQEGASASWGIYAQRFSPAGAAQGIEFHVNTYTTDFQFRPSIALDASGDFVVAWEGWGQDTSGVGVYAQRFNAAGAAQGGEFRANSFITGDQNLPAATIDADGDFLITWTSSGQDGSGYGVYARHYNAAGTALATEFRANTTTTGTQSNSSIAMTPAGDAVAAWIAYQDGSSAGIVAQRYDESTDTAGPIVAGVFVNGERVLPYQVYASPVSQFVLSFSENMSDAGGSGGVNSVTNPVNWLVTRDGIDITSGASITYGFNPATNRFEAGLTLSQSYTGGNFLLKAKDNIRDITGNQLDGNLDAVPGGNLLLPFSLQSLGPLGGEFRVNTYTTTSDFNPALAADDAGDFVVVWQSNYQDGSVSGIQGRRYNGTGVAQGSEFRVNTYTTGAQTIPSVAMSANGAFVVAWESNGQDGAGDGVYAQRYNSAGIAQGSEFRVNTTTLNTESQPSVAMDDDGDFVITWVVSNVSFCEVFAQRYTSSGVALGSEFRVNSYTTNNQIDPSVAMDANGAFVVAWSSYFQDGDSRGIYAQRYDAAGTVLGGEFRVNTVTTSDQAGACVAMGATGGFVVTWRSPDEESGGDEIYAQLYGPAGVAQGTQFRVNTYTPTKQTGAQVAMNSAGNFVVTWDSAQQDSSPGYGTYGQRYNSAGVAQGIETLINEYTTGGQTGPAVAMDDRGNFVVAWRGEGASDPFGVFSRRFGVRNTPIVGTLADNPDSVTAGNSLNLIASGAVADSGTVGSVSFYRETNGEPGLQVGAFGDTLVGTDTTESAGFWSINIATASLAAGTYAYWAQATDDAGLIGAPAATTNTVAPSPGPLVLAAEFQYETSPQKLKFTFDRNVSASFGTNDILLERIGGGSVPALTSLSPGPMGTNYFTITMGSLLADGNYRATLQGTAAGPGSGIRDPISSTPMAANYVFDFFIIGGDADHNRVVDARDLVILANNWLGSGKTWSQADFNYDGTVNQIDLTVMAQHWQQNLAPPPPAGPAIPTGARSPVRAPVRTPLRVQSDLGTILT